MRNFESRKKIVMVYALDGKTDGYIAIQPNQLKCNTVTASMHINKTFEGTTRIMEYEELSYGQDYSGK